MSAIPEDSEDLKYRNWRLPWVAEAAPSAIRELIGSQNWKGKTGELAIETVKLQLQVYEQNLEAASRTTSNSKKPVPSLVEVAARKLAESLEDDPEGVDVVMNISNPSIAQAFCSLHNIPYSVFCNVRTHLGSMEPNRKRVHKEGDKGSTASTEFDIDTWILQNEDWLRARRIRDPNAAWTTGLIAFDHFRNVFGFSLQDQENYFKLTRQEVDGFKFLDAYRQPHIYVQSNLDRFRQTFDQMTNGQLKGLEWSNLFVAGGLVLGALLCVDAEDAVNKPKQWESSDIDIYIYGLTPIQANAKIHHLYDVFKSNIPTSAPVLVVRNSKTISFISNYPTRRFQIILKICQSPAEVLLNFDLDICAVGYDGAQIYMLPRAARALETGYNVFTMDMVQGHYLGTRRASQEQRVFKYAGKGYGIRILPSYLDALKTVDGKMLPPRDYGPHGPHHLDINKQAEKARDYFDRVFRTYLSWTDDGEQLKRVYVDSWRPVFSGSSKDIRTQEQKDKRIPIFTHALFDTVGQSSTEPLRRSCLTGFELLYRHVGLFEAEAAGKCVIEPNVWASTTYEDVYFSSTYSDLPNYVWDETFQISDFTKRLDEFNEAQSGDLERDWELSGGDEAADAKEPTVRRIVHGATVEEVFKTDLIMMIWMPENFVSFARETVMSVAKDRDIPFQGDFISEFWRPSKPTKGEALILYEVKIDTLIMWQQVDRRLDEIFELLWSFMLSNHWMQLERGGRYKLLRQQISRRALRSKTENEFLDFALWVARDPGPISGENYGAMGQGFWWEAFRDSEEESEEEHDGYDDYYDEYDDDDDTDYYTRGLEATAALMSIGLLTHLAAADPDHFDAAFRYDALRFGAQIEEVDGDEEEGEEEEGDEDEDEDGSGNGNGDHPEEEP
ncbi:hypothetical protein FRC17_002740 [Serendipita sp. 399]|nr:hypothetical protein FRC17_002740 [Serendipita sp. 399]